MTRDQSFWLPPRHLPAHQLPPCGPPRGIPPNCWKAAQTINWSLPARILTSQHPSQPPPVFTGRIRNNHLGHLKHEISRVLDDLGSDFDQLLTQPSQRPPPHRLGQCETPQEIAEVVGPSEQLYTDLIVHEVMTRQPGPLQCAFALFDPLLGRTPLVVRPHYIAGLPPGIRHNETDSWNQFPCTPLDLHCDPARGLPTGRPIAEIVIQDNQLLRWTPDRASRQVLDPVILSRITWKGPSASRNRSTVGSAKPASPRKDRRMSWPR